MRALTPEELNALNAEEFGLEREPPAPMATQVQEKFRRASERRSVLDADWRRAISFVNNRPFIENVVAPTMWAPPRPRSKVALTENRLAATVNLICAKVASNDPGILGVAINPSYQARLGAAAVSHWYRWSHQVGNFRVRYEQALWWSLVCGNGFLYASWKQHAGVRLLSGEWSGRVTYEVVEPFDVFPDPLASDLDSATWVVLRHTMTRGEFERQFPVSRPAQEDSWDWSSYTTRQWLVQGYTGTGDDDHVVVLEYLERPSKEFPVGRRLLVNGQEILVEEDLLDGLFPLVVVRDFFTGGAFWSMGRIRALEDLQTQLNQFWSKTNQLQNLYAFPVWMAPEGSCSPSALTNDPERPVFYNANKGAPRRDPPPPFPQGLIETRHEITGAIADLSGASEINFGQVPSDTSGRALGYLEDMERGRLSSLVDSLERAICDAAAVGLALWRRFAPESVSLAVMTQMRSPEVRLIQTERLIDVMVSIVPGSMLPYRPSQRREQILVAFQQGLYGPPQDPVVARKVRGLIGPDITQGFDPSDTVDRASSEVELEALLQGGYAKVEAWHDHIEHMDVFRAYMADVVAWNQTPTEVQEQILYHYYEHERCLSLAEGGQPTTLWMEGQPVQQLREPSQMAPEMGTEGAAPEPDQDMPGLAGGGTPELNGAYNPAGPGVDGYAEDGGFTAA